jgi:hypothetical protein
MVMPKEYAPISLSIESITVRAGKYVLMEVDDNRVFSCVGPFYEWAVCNLDP